MPLRGERHPGRPEAGEIGAQAEGLIVGAVRGEAGAAEPDTMGDALLLLIEGAFLEALRQEADAGPAAGVR